MEKLDPETFKFEEGGAYWRFWRTDRLGQFDIAVMAATEDFSPEPWAIARLEQELAQVDVLFEAALAAAKAHRVATYNWRLPPDSAWTLTRLAIEANGDVLVVLYEGDLDTYGAWDVTMRDGAIVKTERRQI